MKSNIVLIGMPGSGKTTIGKPLAEHTGKSFLDFDDDVIEIKMQKPVSECLSELGEEGFLEMETRLALDLDIRQTVLATSGSVALSLKAMSHLRKDATSIYIDVPTDIITQRLVSMKVDRIVGMGEKSLEEILAYRQSFYENSYDYKFVNDSSSSPEEIQATFMSWFQQTVH